MYRNQNAEAGCRLFSSHTQTYMVYGRLCKRITGLMVFALIATGSAACLAVDENPTVDSGGKAVTIQRDNDEILLLQTQDRDATLNMNLSWQELQEQGEQRRAKVLKLLSQGKLHNGYDYWRAAMIFQHGNSPDSYRRAHAFAVMAESLMSDQHTRWLVAASWDRLLNSLGKPQWYGTQYLPSADAKWWLLADMDVDAVSDQSRRAYTGHAISEMALKIPREVRPGQPDKLPDGYFNRIWPAAQEAFEQTSQ